MDNFLENLKTKNIHIVGAFGAEGSAILKFLAKNGIKNITAHDLSTDIDELRKNFFNTHLWIKKTERLEAFEKLFKMPAKINLKDKYLAGILEADMIFAPSSWYLYKPNFPALEEARKKGIPISSITKLYFELAKGKIISITGTKGKGTTSRLIYDILLKSAAGRKVYLAGNDRRAAQELDKVAQMAKDDILVLETSNRQLMIDLGRSPDIGVITNISPDHIDEHGSFEKYIETKKSLFQYQEKGDVAILNYDNEITSNFGKELIAKGVNACFFSRKVSPEFIRRSLRPSFSEASKRKKTNIDAFVENGKIYILGNGVSKSLGHSMSKLKKEYICDLADIKLIGEHNIENVLAAALAGYLAGAKPGQIKKAIRNFKGLPHRIEFIGEYGGVKFYDDLASTNPESTIAAIKALKSDQKPQVADCRLILVAGGDDKGMDYSNLTEEIIKKIDTLILLPGTGTEKIKFQIPNSKFQIINRQAGLKVKECNDFLEALDFINKNKKTGDIALISPASAHFQARYIDVLKKPTRNLIVEKFR